jgi:nitroreductase
METIATLLEHRSIRNYKSTPIPENVLNSILEAAIRGSNTGNMQVYSIIVTKNTEIKQKLLPAHFGQKMVLDAPVLLTFCADFNRFNRWCESRNATPGYDNIQSFSWAMVDAVIAAQNAAVAAESFGLGICYLGTTTYNADKIIEILNLPKGVVPITTLTVGYALDNPLLTDRLPLEALIHTETYHDYSVDDINRLYSEKESLSSTVQLVEENKTENLAQIFTQKRYTKTDNIHFSKVWLDVLAKQSFMNND